MDKTDFKEVAAAALNAADGLLAEWLPGGKYRGHEYVACNPTRADQKAGSFTINTHSGVWSDFATGDSGGDLISLYAYLFCSGRQGDALQAVAERLRVGNFAKADRQPYSAAAKKGDNKHPVAPFDEAHLAALPLSRAYDFARRGREEGFRAVYRDAEGRPLCVVQRFFDEGGGKTDLPFALCYDGGRREYVWSNRRIADPQPLFGLDDLAARPSDGVLLVEGEKCRLAAREYARQRQLVAVSWLGGSSGWKKANWQPLAGRDVVIWPDCDSQRQPLTRKEAADGLRLEDKPYLPWHEQPGMKAALGIAEKLHGMGCRVKMVKVPEPGLWPAGYDIADALEVGAAFCPSIGDILIDSPEDGVFRRLSADAAHAAEDGAGNGWRDDELVDSDERESAMLADLLENYRQIGQKQKVVNYQTGETFTRAQLVRAFSELSVNCWFRADVRKIISEVQAEIHIKQCKLKAKAEYDRLGGMLDRYIYLDGTTDAYDTALDMVVSLAAVKAANAEDFEDWNRSEQRMVCPIKNLVFEPALVKGVLKD